MKVIYSASELPRTSNIAFVPTMGALHSGHQSLIQRAREFTENVLVSIYVNPLQFESANDLANYPKTPERDVELAEAAGAKYLWFPHEKDLYPYGKKEISAGEIGKKFEGATRSGHFNGVVTVVNALFEAVNPKWALFGEKDLQQLFLIKKMSASLHPQISIIACETVRDSDGLALSSRNVRLNSNNRDVAKIISIALRSARGVNGTPTKLKVLRETLMSESRFILDYAEIIDGESFEIATDETRNQRAIVAGWVDGVRLIDTMPMNPIHENVLVSR